MFDESVAILYTLLIEGNEHYSCSEPPIRKGAEIFVNLLAELPVSKGPFPGIFGLESLSPEAKAVWKKRIDDTKNKTIDFCDEPKVFSEFSKLGFSLDNGGRGHITVDFGEVLKSGLKSFYDRLDQTDGFDRIIGETLLAVKKFAEKFDCSVPWFPARDFEEALNSIWLTYECLVFSEHVSWSYSWGRMDQYLLPYSEGMSHSELKARFVSFFRFLNQVPFKDDACALNIGGPDGFNAVSRAIIDAAAEVRLPAPLLAVRVSRNLPDADFALTLRKELLTCGQPTFYGEESCRKALNRRGMPASEIENWVANSCMGLMIPGREWQDMWGSVLQMTTALELTLNNGSFFRMASPVECRIPVIAPDDYQDFETLYRQVMRYVRWFFELFVPAMKEKRTSMMNRFQNPFAVPFHADCLDRKKEMRDGGSRYFTMIVETMGLANLADSLFTIEQLVFTQKKYTLKSLCSAMKNDFADAEELLGEIRRLPKYGQNHPGINALMRRLADDIASIAESFSSDGFFCSPSLHTLNSHIYYGQTIEATADGRRAHTPLAKNAGSGRDTIATHTERILSALAWDQSRFSGGQPLDLWIDQTDWETEDGIRSYTKLFRTYLENGGLQIQLNGADPEILKDAMVHPENYPDLTVRIGGFSVRFIRMDKLTQIDFIERFSRGM